MPKHHIIHYYVFQINQKSKYKNIRGSQKTISENSIIIWDTGKHD